MVETKTLSCGNQKHHVFGEYVLTPIPNAFNGKTGWWLSKRNHTLSVYCFSTLPHDTKEAEYQIKHIEGHFKVYESLLAKLRGM